MNHKSGECRCGDVYGSQGTRPETDCSMACNGDSSQICGEANANSIYEIVP